MTDQWPLYLVGDAETGEAYVARLIPEPEGIYGPETRPLVQILRVAAYPRQHAIQDPGVALEIPAIPKGTFTRLSLIAEISADDVDTGSYEISLRRAQQEALELAETEKEREIIRRHMAGEYYRRRLVKSYTREEVKFMVDQHSGKKPEAENGIHQDLG